MTRNFEGPFVSITGAGIDPISARTERLLNDAADFIAATHGQPADSRAWTQLLTYAPAEVLLERLIGKLWQSAEQDFNERASPRDRFEEIIRSLNYDGGGTDSLTVGEIRRALP